MLILYVLVHQHGALISKNKKIVCKGTNHDRNFCSGKIYGPSFHAEMDAIRKWEAIFLKGKMIDVFELSRFVKCSTFKLVGGLP